MIIAISDYKCCQRKFWKHSKMCHMMERRNCTFWLASLLWIYVHDPFSLRFWWQCFELLVCFTFTPCDVKWWISIIETQTYLWMHSSICAIFISLSKWKSKALISLLPPLRHKFVCAIWMFQRSSEYNIPLFMASILKGAKGWCVSKHY